MKESSKGKLSDRAILLEVMPTGTVLLEVALATQVSYYYCGHILYNMSLYTLYNTHVYMCTSILCHVIYLLTTFYYLW